MDLVADLDHIVDVLDPVTAVQLADGGDVFFFSSRRRHTRWTGDWSSDVCSSDLGRAWVRARGELPRCWWLTGSASSACRPSELAGATISASNSAASVRRPVLASVCTS